MYKKGTILAAFMFAACSTPQDDTVIPTEPQPFTAFSYAPLLPPVEIPVPVPRPERLESPEYPALDPECKSIFDFLTTPLNAITKEVEATMLDLIETAPVERAELTLSIEGKKIGMVQSMGSPCGSRCSGRQSKPCMQCRNF